jgi:hypothetical protein
MKGKEKLESLQWVGPTHPVNFACNLQKTIPAQRSQNRSRIPRARPSSSIKLSELSCEDVVEKERQIFAPVAGGDRFVRRGTGTMDHSAAPSRPSEITLRIKRSAWDRDGSQTTTGHNAAAAPLLQPSEEKPRIKLVARDDEDLTPTMNNHDHQRAPPQEEKPRGPTSEWQWSRRRQRRSSRRWSWSMRWRHRRRCGRRRSGGSRSWRGTWCTTRTGT